MKNKAGFTLLEILVCLAILTISLTAMVSVSSQRADTLLQLRDKNDALEVAHSVLQEHYQTSISGRLQTGKKNRWYWKLEVKNTDNEFIQRLDVMVSEDSSFKYAQAQLSGFKWR